MTPQEKTAAFRVLHKPGAPFVIPNPWDEGSARILEGLGFKALATTSSGFALTKGRLDYGVTREEALDHARAVAAAVAIPVSADLENGFGPDIEDARETIRLAAETGLAGGSIEDTSGDKNAPILDATLAAERIAAAAEAARESENGFILTARADGLLHGERDLDAIIARLLAFEKAGADVLYAPGLKDIDWVRTVCASVSKPVNVLLYGGLLDADLQALAGAGAARISVGGALAWAAYATLGDLGAPLVSGDFSALAATRGRGKNVGGFLKS